MGYILRAEDVLRYYHPSIGNSCLHRTAFDVSGDENLTRFKTEFEHGNWLDLNSHLNLRPNTKSVVECVCSITFYVYLVAGIYQFVGTPPTTMPDYFKVMSFSLWRLTPTDKNMMTTCVFSGT